MGTAAKDALDEGLMHSIDNLIEYYLDAPPQRRPLSLSELENPLGASSTSDATDHMISSSIGLSGEGFRASLNLLAQADTLVQLCPDKVCNPMDWGGELANQLIGRVKNVISEYGVESHMSLPISVHGVEIGYNDQVKDAQALHIDTNVGTLAALWHVRTEPDLEWEHDPDQASADEGSLCLF